MMNGYLVFLLAGRLFGAKLAGAIEIVPWRVARTVPLSYTYVEGLIDYRGVVYPVFNIQQLMNLHQQGPIGFLAEKAEIEAATRSIILLEEQKKPFGVTVDGVLRMITVDNSAVTPGKAEGIDPRYIIGIVQYEEYEVVVLDFERLLHAG